MITGEIKNRIDSIWDTFFSAGITNPITVLEQMTYLFFMKMIDDSQRKKESLAESFGAAIDHPTFKQGTWHNPDTDKDVAYDSLRWHVFKNMPPEQMYKTISQDVFVFIKNLNEGAESAYSQFMANATFMIPKAHTLVKIIDYIDNLDMNNRDTMGDVYEYVLGKMAASGNNGQFRTPRHIIEMMVHLMKPTLEDTICDPAMGSAGFIVESAKYIRENYKGKLQNKGVLDHYQNNMFHGFDTDQTMLRIGAMNLMLHGVSNPDIKYQDSLSDENLDENRYSLCLANPPFTGSLDNETVAKSLLAICKTKKTELLFVTLFVRMLKMGGRCASIVPDGLLFGSSSAHKAVRKELVDHQRLQAVISMPSGVFQPYSGVATSILIFTKTNAGGTDKVWFYDMRNDGYTLDVKRTPCDGSDIPDIIQRFEHLDAEAERTRFDQSFMVDVEEIRQNDYDLTFNKYKQVQREAVVYRSTEEILADIKTSMQESATLMNELEEMLK